MEEKVTVGKIQGFPVLYIPSRGLLFCKNTIVPFEEMRKVLHAPTAKHRIERSNLNITKMDNIIELGCLTTTVTNLIQIEKQINGLR